MTTRLLSVLALAFLLSTAAVAAQSGPTISWDYVTTDVSNVTAWQVCVDTVCTTVTPVRAADVGTTASFSFQLATPLTLASHTFVVNACNPVACTGSDPLTISLPVKPKNVRAR
jgi:hypothetical protein